MSQIISFSNTDKFSIVLNEYYNFVLSMITIHKKALSDTNNNLLEDKSLTQEYLEALEVVEQMTYKLLKILNEELENK